MVLVSCQPLPDSDNPATPNETSIVIIPTDSLDVEFTNIPSIEANSTPLLSPSITSSTNATQTDVKLLDPVSIQTDTPFPTNPYGEHPLPTQTLTATPTLSYESGINPLTGLVPASPDNLERKPVFIKVSNYPPYGRPHAGLSAADIVYEYYIGEGLNRFMAVYYGNNASLVGPIRSGRLVDAQLVEMYQGYLVYGGADERVDSVIVDILGKRSIDVTNNYPCPPICGTDTHSETGVFADSAKITDYINGKGMDNTRPDLAGLSFSETIPSGESYAVKVGVQFSKFCRGEWRYDPDSQTYLRWIEQDLDINIMVPLVDRNTGDQLSFDNVIIIFADHVIYTPTLYDIEIWKNYDGMPMVLFRDGFIQEGIWKTVDDQHPMQFLDSDNNLLQLKPGNTWIVIASPQTTIESTSEGVWEMRFALP